MYRVWTLTGVSVDAMAIFFSLFVIFISVIMNHILSLDNSNFDFCLFVFYVVFLSYYTSTNFWLATIWNMIKRDTLSMHLKLHTNLSI